MKYYQIFKMLYKENIVFHSKKRSLYGDAKTRYSSFNEKINSVG